MNDSILQLFDVQQGHQQELRMSSAGVRIGKLRRLKANILKFESRIFEALEADLRKNAYESALTEVYFIYSEIDYAIKRLPSWMRKKSKPYTFTSFLSKNWIQYESLGTSLIISPWNYPFQLSMSPLVSAIAAGCSVILKPSEYSPKTSEVIKDLIEETFSEKEVKCLLGEKELATELLKLPFNKIFFTGNPEVGKIVMKAGAEHLSSVTLELGGKSPVIIAEDYDLKAAALKIAWGKLINAGQTCIAPDYLFIPQGAVESFNIAFQDACRELFYQDGELDYNRYAKIINSRHQQRIEGLLDDALQRNAKILWQASGGDQQSISPVLITDVDQGSKIMEEEIFGPLLPVISYTNIQEVVEHINARPKPLAMYIFSDSGSFSNELLRRCSSGSVCINDVLIQVSNPNLPFGGVNHSGIGSCHGFYGFKAFSHERAIMKQTKFSFSKMIYPPYQGKESIFKLLKKWM